MTYLKQYPQSADTVMEQLYKSINVGSSTNDCKHPIPQVYVEHVASNIDINTRVVTGNVEVVTQSTNSNAIIGGISINSTDEQVFRTVKPSMPIFDLDKFKCNPEQAIINLRMVLKRYRDQGQLRLICVGNLPFKGEGDKLWQIILSVLREAGFDEIHIIIPASGINSQEMKQASFDGLKAIHFMRPERWLNSKGNYEITKLCAMIEIHKDYTGEVSVYDDFNFLYSRPLYNSKGQQNFFAPIEHWPEIEDVLVNMAGSSDFIFGDSTIFKSKRLEGGKRAESWWVNYTGNDAVIDINKQGITFGSASKVDRWWKSGITNSRITFKGRGLDILDNLTLIGDHPIAVKQAQWFEPTIAGVGQGVISLAKTNIAKSLVVATTPDTSNAFNSPAFRLLNAFDCTQVWSDQLVEALFKPKHVKALKDVLDRYQAIYKV